MASITFDRIDEDLIRVLLEQGPHTPRALRNLKAKTGGPMFNYRSLKKHIDSLVKRKCINARVEPGCKRRDEADPKTVLSIGESELRQIVEEEAKSSGKFEWSLPLEVLKGVSAIAASKDRSHVKIDKVEFDLVGYDKDESGSKKVVRIEKGLVWKPGPPLQSPMAGYEDLTGLTKAQKRKIKIIIPKAQAGPVVRALAKEQQEPLQLPAWF